jgi:D-alanyl-D-alanine carboxypeptidase
MHWPYSFLSRTLLIAASASAALSLATIRADAEALLLVEVDSGKVLHAENATIPWYPASVTKLMTAYVTLRAIKEGRVSFDTLLPFSANAVAQAPTKMGFAVGTTVTIDNALKMLMVKSANDIAVVLAEGVGGSIEKFSDLMNSHAQRLGMTQSHFVNPNGLPADEQITSARDMAILARTILREFPEYDFYWKLPGIRFGKTVMRNHNNLMGRYPGVDGMKTGFICASGFNVVATATHDGKRLIAVVFGSPSPAVRAVKAAQLFERGFGTTPLSWLVPALGQVDALQAINVAPPNLREEMCGKHRKRPPAEEDGDPIAANAAPDSPYAVFLSSLRAPTGKQTTLLQDVHVGEPVRVWVGAKPPAPGTEDKAAKSAIKPAPKAAKTASAPSTAAPKTAKPTAAPATSAPKPGTPKAAAAPAAPAAKKGDAPKGKPDDAKKKALPKPKPATTAAAASASADAKAR